MFLKPIKYDQSVVTPSTEIKDRSKAIFSRILKNYRENLVKFEKDPQANSIKDPWFKREAWRWDPFFSKQNIFKNSFPGLKLATFAFSIYLIYDFTLGNTEKKNHH